MQRNHAIVYLLLLLVGMIFPGRANAYSIDEIPNVHVADRTRFLSNPDGIISPAAQQRADSIMAGVWNSKSAEIVAVVVNSIGDADANQFATELFTKWGIGKSDRDNGVLLLVVNDTHDIVIRTGYGVEGVLPDISAGRIIRSEMYPAFRRGDFDSGVLNALTKISTALSDPTVAAELKSGIANDAAARGNHADESMGEMLLSLLRWGVVLLVLMLIIVVMTHQSARKESPQKQYIIYNNLATGALVATVAGFGLPIIAYLIARYLKQKSRTTSPSCPECGDKMQLINGATKLQYLSPQQQTETRIGSKDYDVWQCPRDGRTVAIGYPGPHAGEYTQCGICGADACKISSRRTVVAPTTTHAGYGEEQTTCLHCGNITRRRYSIAKLATPVVVGGIGGFGGGRGGGGFGGGSFGGGMTGGGGASGRW